MEYRPQPIDTTLIELDPTLIELTEYLARNTHEVWARLRMSQGWTWGPQRDDAAMKHPNLVPYDELSDADKQVDRASAMETLRLILALGWQIEPPERSESAGDKPVIASGDDVVKLPLSAVVALWQHWDRGESRGWLEDYRKLGKRALELGEFLLAFDILKDGRRRWPDDVTLRQLQAQALARSGAAETALRVLNGLREQGHEDDETLGIVARTYKDLYERATDPVDREKYLTRACEGYEQAYQRNGGYWTGINAATLAACLGRAAEAANLAMAVQAQCVALMTQETEPDYWLLATLGEAALATGDNAQAATYYGQAVKVAGQKFGNISSTRRNARLLLREAFGIAPADVQQRLDALLPLPRVAVFSGHMIDARDRSSPRFPREMESVVAEEIRRRLDALNAGFGYASAASGADILFHEAMLARGAETNVVLPYEAERFITESVGPAGPEWVARFHALLANPHARVSIASEGRVEGDKGLANEFANTFTFGLAGIRAWQLGAELAPLAVWDGQPGAVGGTADAVAQWQARECRATIIPLDELLRRRDPGAAKSCAAPTTSPATSSSRKKDLGSRLMALLFADVAGFSKLTEDEIPLFVRHFFQPVADLIARSPYRPVQQNTWGDGLYFVFEDAAAAGAFALELRDLVAATDWKSLGFKRELGLRTGLHVGPVMACLNPVTGHRDFIGTHVSRAARIEPVTPKGQVYASEVFAAISFAQGTKRFVCEYVGRMGMAKGYGTYPTYHVRPA